MIVFSSRSSSWIVDSVAAWSYDGGMVFDPGFRITEKVELASRCDRGWQPRSRVIARRIGRRRDGRAPDSSTHGVPRCDG